MEYEAVDGLDVRLDGAALRCTLNRPKTRNSLDSEMMIGLIRAGPSHGDCVPKPTVRYRHV